MTTHRERPLAFRGSAIALIAALIATLTIVGGALTVIAPSEAAAAAPPGLQPLLPTRMLDTRELEFTADALFEGTGRMAANSTIEVQITGRVGIPNNATAVMLNVTAVLPSAGTFLTVYPCDSGRPNASNVNAPPNDIRANNVFVKLSATGTVCIYTVAETDVVVDMNGYVPAGGNPISQAPARLLETRPGQNTIDGLFNGIGRVGPESVTTVQVAGRAGVPADAKSALLNVTGILPSAGSLLTVYPCDSPRPDASTLNLPAGDIRANGAFVKLSATGTACIYSVAASDIVVDVNGYVPVNGSAFSVTPARLIETRPGYSTIDRQGDRLGRRPKESMVGIQVAGRGGVPLGATSAFLNITAINPEADTFFTVYPCATERPNSSNLNTPAHDIRANGLFVRLNQAGAACLYTVAATDLVVDVTGYAMKDATTNTCLTQSTGFKPEMVQSRTNLPASECAALGKLFITPTVGSERWSLGVDPCDWTGVSCADGHVIALSLGEVVNYTMPYIGDLPYLYSFRAANVPQIPPEIGKLTRLNVISFTSAKGGMGNLQSIPPEIGNLQNLTVLNLSGEVVQSLPPEIGKLGNLRELNAGTLKTNLPPEIGSLSKLQFLTAKNSYSTSLPASIGNLRNLIYLDLSHTPYTSMPPEIGNLTNLLVLDLEFDQINTLPDSLGNLTNLLVLGLSDNKLTVVPGGIARFTNLFYLTLSNNSFRQDVTNIFLPLMIADRLQYLSSFNSGCMYTRNPLLAAWLNWVDDSEHWDYSACA